MVISYTAKQLHFVRSDTPISESKPSPYPILEGLDTHAKAMVNPSDTLISAIPRSKGKGKQPKRFLDKDAALDLATSIADVQEGKSLGKAEKHRRLQAGHPRADHKSRPSASKVKLKQTKAQLAAQRTQIKKEKIKRRKQRSTDKASKDETTPGSSAVIPKTVARKSVSFA